MDYNLDSEPVYQTLLKNSFEYQESASKHRLNQPTGSRQNPALQAATATKEKLNMLKKLTKADTITIEMTLYIFPATGAAAKKVMHGFCSNFSACLFKGVDTASSNTKEGFRFGNDHGCT